MAKQKNQKIKKDKKSHDDISYKVLIDPKPFVLDFIKQMDLIEFMIELRLVFSRFYGFAIESQDI